MLNGIINWSLHHRFIVLAVAAAFVALGVLSLPSLPIDAFPDTTPVQVQINTTAPALGPEEVERQITFPVEQVVSGLPRLQQLRSLSKFGLSQVVVVFQDGTDIYFARQVINERLNTVELPQGLNRPVMGPITTGLGEVYQYTLTSRKRSLTDLRTLQDWVIRPALRTVPGTAEINSWGGYNKEYQVRVDPSRLIQYGLTFNQVTDAVRNNNLNAGGGHLNQSGEMYLVQGQGRTVNVAQIGDIVVATPQAGVPVRVRDVADVEIGHAIRMGGITTQGRGETVLGLGFILVGENPHAVTSDLKVKMAEVKKTLPADVLVRTVYDRTLLVDHVIATVRNNLFEGGLLVIAVLFIFLGHMRAGLIVATAIPLSMLFAFSGMLRFGITASLLSLGALDFGLVVDSSVVMVENCVRHIAHDKDHSRPFLDVIRDAALEVRLPTTFGELIIMIVYLPILTLEGVEGKLFRPMALTVIFALVGSMVMSLTLMPVLASLLLSGRQSRVTRLFRRVYGPVLDRLSERRGLARALLDAGDLAVSSLLVLLVLLLIFWSPATARVGWQVAVALSAVVAGLLLAVMSFRSALQGAFFPGEELEPVLIRLARRGYDRVLRLALGHGVAVLGVALGALGVGVMLARSLGAEFVPTLSEGALVVGIMRLPGTSLEESLRYNTRMEQILREHFPDEVEAVWSRCGTAEVATDPMGPEETDFFITLKPRAQWTRAHTQDELTGMLRDEFDDLPGQTLNFTQPIQQRVTEMISGSRAAVAVKVFGDDFSVLKDKADEVQKILSSIPGSADVNVPPISGQPSLQVELRQDQLARYGVSARQVFDLLESLAGKPLGEVIEGQLRFPLAVRLPEDFRSSPSAVDALLVTAPSGERVPLSRLARIDVAEGPAKINREWGRRLILVQCNVSGRDMGSFVDEARRRVDAEVKLPGERYRIEWGGEFENLDRARRRLLLVVPGALALIFVLLYMTYNRLRDVLLVFTAVPFASVGGVLALWLRELPFSISAGVGFIALSGVSVLNSMVLVSFIRHLRDQGVPQDRAIEEAALTRLRPVLMTALVASLGFLPMALSTGVGAEVQRPLATVVIGGVISSTLLTLLVLPVLYHFFGASEAERAAGPPPQAPQAHGGAITAGPVAP